MADECILYPCYFNAALPRRQGRKVPRQNGAKGPSLSDVERALKKLRIRFRPEDQHHPAHWMRKEGRVVVEWKEAKGALIRNVAKQMGGRK
jgi:signal recognition particle subunit SRP19